MNKKTMIIIVFIIAVLLLPLCIKAILYFQKGIFVYSSVIMAILPFIITLIDLKKQDNKYPALNLFFPGFTFIFILLSFLWPDANHYFVLIGWGFLPLSLYTDWKKAILLLFFPILIFFPEPGSGGIIANFSKSIFTSLSSIILGPWNSRIVNDKIVMGMGKQFAIEGLCTGMEVLRLSWFFLLLVANNFRWSSWKILTGFISVSVLVFAGNLARIILLALALFYGFGAGINTHQIASLLSHMTVIFFSIWMFFGLNGGIGKQNN